MVHPAEYNPYAPPAATSVAGFDRPDEPAASASYENERRSVPLLLVLTIVTLGVYPAIWYFRRARFLDSLQSDTKLGAMAWAPLAATGLAVVLSFVGLPPELDRMLSSAAGIVSLITAFRVASILRGDSVRSGRLLRVSGAATFFFGALYLQQKMNEAAGTPGRVVR
jgi:hypothetical protein